TAGSIAATSNAIGGSGGLIGNGGAADGGLARIAARQGGTLTVSGQTFVRAGGFGGSGGSNGGGAGGAGRGGTSTDTAFGAIISGNGGNITLGTFTQVTADGVGGTGRGIGVAGAGTGGLANVVAFNGTVDARAGQLSVTADGRGGDALATAQTGGNGGGAGTGGMTIVSAGTTVSAAGAVGRLLLGTATASAAGVGGIGGNGLNGQAGGTGGDGTGGRVDVIAQAGNGVLTASAVTVTVSGTGGLGGGGSAGGSGGIGTGGGGNVGTASLPDSPFTTGSASIDLVDIAASGFGGDGGTGSSAATAGAGGAGIGGGYALLSRGAALTTGRASIRAAGIGGAGGNAVAGIGGRGEGGEAGLLVTNRANSTARGSATIQQFIADTSAVGGGGTGPSVAGRSYVTLTNGDATVGSLFFTNSGALPVAGLISNLSASGGTLTVPTASIAAIGDIGLYTANSGRIVIGNGFLNATGTLRFGDGTTPSNIPGALDITNLIAFPGTDLEIGRAFAVAGDLTLSSAGAIRVGDLAAGGRLDLTATGAITTGNLAGGGVVIVGGDRDIAVLDVESATASVDLSAGEALSAGDVRAADLIALTAGGALTAGNLTALTQPDLLADGAAGSVAVLGNGTITVGDVTGLDIDIDGTDLSGGRYGNIVTGFLTGEFIEVTGGAAVNVAGVRTAELYSGGLADQNVYAAELGALGDLTVGNIDSLGLVALASGYGSISAGAITTPSSIVALAAGNVDLVTAASGYGATDSLFVGNASMLETNPALARVLEDNEDPPFDPAILTTLTPVRIGGTFTVTGPVTTGNLIAAAQDGVALGTLDATTRIVLDSGNAIALGDVTTPAELDLTSDGDITAGNIVAEEVGLVSLGGSIATGAITANDEIILEALAANGTITTGLLRSGDEIGVIAGAAVNIAGASLTASDDDSPDGVGVIAGTNLTIGAVDSAQRIGLLARAGDINTGTLLARSGDIVLLAAGSVTTAGATTSPANTVYVGNASQFPADFDPDDDDIDLGSGLLETRPVRIGGAFTATGPIATGSLRAAAQNGVALGAIDAATLIALDSGDAIALGDVTT
ncbi:MAG: hypothetical protein ABW128_20080, partial [Rhizorhabdus sp.]